ncbi:hypothetical protein HMPREF9075_01392 [Capnocytophaga sp. oral taxon 332 str. F0381]|nr:hypothetical protein HMPREF9075_01392 [Capnocytophaga sp. oral taxon 332 str. F0381]
MANEKRLPETKPFGQPLFFMFVRLRGGSKKFCSVRAICQSPLQCD